jgi:beta-galactosidase
VERGTLDRRLGQSSLSVRLDLSNNTPDILVENGGRINFNKQLLDQRKGIAPPVMFAGKELRGWQIYPLRMSDVPNLRFSPAEPGKIAGPGFLRGRFSLAATGDTYLNVRGFGKGVVWVNDHLLGRFWDVGPQQTLYLPAPWLKIGKTRSWSLTWTTSEAGCFQHWRARCTATDTVATKAREKSVKKPAGQNIRAMTLVML